MTTVSANEASEPLCIGCHLVIEEGSVIAFGDALFHLECFTCAKCAREVDCSSNLLLLNDGRPLCEQCSYICAACKQPTQHEAIMIGDEVYHAECFRCVSCKQVMSDLIFAQTSRGIYCRPCHHQRKAEKLRRKEEKEKRWPGASKGSEVPAVDTSTITQSGNFGRHGHASRILDAQMVTDYLQMERAVAHMTNESTLSVVHELGPPTPVRSRSSSVEATMRSSSINPQHAPPTLSRRPSPSRSENSLSPLSTSSSATLSINTASDRTFESIYQLKDGSVSKGDINSSLDLSTATIPSLNLSFFDDDSSSLSNLTLSLGANLSLPRTTSQPSNQRTVKKKPSSILTSKINKASELLSSTLQQSSSSHATKQSPLDGFPQPPSHAFKSLNLDSDIIPTDRESVLRLRNELKAARAQLGDMETNFSKLKEASRRALDEFTRAKEEFGKEVALRQQHEYTMMQMRQQITVLQRAKSGKDGDLALLAKDEIDHLARVRVELERTCNELHSYRNNIAKEIDRMVQQKQAGLASTTDGSYIIDQQQKALQNQVKSLTLQRDTLQKDTEQLMEIREEVIREMILLNTKNAELTSMNNSLSLRLTERGEREGGYHNESIVAMQRESSETSSAKESIASRDSFQGMHSPKMFKIKKGNVWGKFGAGKSNKTEPVNTVYGEKGAMYSSSSTSLSSMHWPTERTRQGSKQSQETPTHGTHAFQPTSFLRPVKCGVCSEKMWGRSEYRCQGCGFSSHAKCLSHVPQLCYASTQSTFELTSPSCDDFSTKSVSMFGTDLSKQVMVEGRAVPLLVERCIAAVEARGMDYEGIYRKSGGAAQMRAIILAFEHGDDIDLEDMQEYNDICAVTSVLKQYFRELPDPLLSYDLYPQFIDAVSMNPGPEKTDKFIELLSQLPKANYDTLRLLVQHLHCVRERSSENLMTTKNLAMVFGPTLMRDRDASRDLLDMSYKNATIEYIINQANDIFTK